MQLLGLLVMMMALNVSAADQPLPTVSWVDLTRYSGTWFEIARYPNRFQRKCTGNVTAKYTLRDDGQVDVLNSCSEGGKTNQAKGTAKVADAQTKAKLKVTFFWPFYGNYWIVDLAPDYSYAVVGEPERKYLWILSRTPSMAEPIYDQVLEKIRSLGYDPGKLLKTPQSGR